MFIDINMLIEVDLSKMMTNKKHLNQFPAVSGVFALALIGMSAALA